jgi:hypothetical protein
VALQVESRPRVIATDGVDAALRAVLQSIEPTPAQKDGARRSHNHLRRLLDSGQMGPRIGDIYLSGSYARNTAIAPLDDVDLIVEIDPAAWRSDYLFSARPSPERLLQSFASALRYRYPHSSVIRQRRSVCLRLNHLDIDVVPAIPTDQEGIILVPDRYSDDWIRSAPKLHTRIASAVNAKQLGQLKPLVKIVKLWNSNLPANARCKSFMIETIATRIFSEIRIGTPAQGAILFWDFLAHQYESSSLREWKSGFGMDFGWFGVKVPDAAGAGSNTATYVDRDRALALCTKARISCDKMVRAASARTDEAMQRGALMALRA